VVREIWIAMSVTALFLVPRHRWNVPFWDE